MADNSYEIGFGKPPRHTQFCKGQSGNPKGRPKGSKNIDVLIRKALEEKVIVKGPGGRRSISKFEAALTQQANKAASGDPRAFREILRLRERVQEQEPFSALRILWSTLSLLAIRDPARTKMAVKDQKLSPCGTNPGMILQNLGNRLDLCTL